MIKTVPRYAKFLKELCKIKRKQQAKKKEKVMVSEKVSAVLQKRLPEKLGDPGMFGIPCIIGKKLIPNAMLDLGASINLMPYHVYKDLNLGPLQDTRTILQLVDRSSVFPRGIIKDVLVEVDKLTLPADFIVLDVKHDGEAAPILLGRPFLRTAKTKIDVENGSLTMEFDEIKLNIIFSNPSNPMIVLTA